MSRATAAERFAGAHLFAADFDDTIALTSEPVDGGINVESAYRLGIASVLGRQALEEYDATGGLRNRAPGEVVRQLAPELEPDLQHQKTEDLIEIKLSHLLKQVGTELWDGAYWPRPVDGFAGTWGMLRWLQGDEALSIDTAIISSGHDRFIEKFFEINDMQPPELLLSDDTLRANVDPTDYPKYVKPSPLLMDTLHQAWAERHGLVADRALIAQMRIRTLYVGNDPEKDGGLAATAEVPFVHIDLLASEESWSRALDLFIDNLQNIVSDR